MIKAALVVDNKDFKLDSELVKFNEQENIELQILEKGQGRKNFLAKVKKLLLENKEAKNFQEEDIKALEDEFDLVINITQTQSLENSLITGLNYAEIVFINKMLNDFCLEDYIQAIEEFKSRKRNFGV
jgi:undecaprenyl pyrophosphate synthase